MICDYASLKLVRDDGCAMEFSGRPGPWWFLPAGCLEGFGDSECDVRTVPNVLRDGSAVSSRRVPEADRTVEGALYLGPNPDAERARAISFLNPRNTIRAVVTYRGRTRWCEGVVTGAKCPLGRLDAPPELTFTLLCPDPFMRSDGLSARSFTDSTAGFGFPFVSHAREPLSDGTMVPPGFAPSRLYYDGAGRVWNRGDVPCGYRVRVDFSATVANPRITHDGRFVEVRDSFSPGDVLVVDFEATPPKVTKNGSNCINRCSRDSSFVGMEMRPGENRFAYSCSDEASVGAMKVTVEHHDGFLGV